MVVQDQAQAELPLCQKNNNMIMPYDPMQLQEDIGSDNIKNNQIVNK